MKKLNVLVAAVAGVIAFGACQDDVETYDPQVELPVIARYVDSLKTIGELSPATQLDDELQIWYDVESLGDGQYKYTADTVGGRPILKKDTLYAKYEGKLLNGVVFDKNTDAAGFKFLLSENIISGWSIALGPKVIKQSGSFEDIPFGGLTTTGISKGGKIRVIMPSVYGYGGQSSQKVPANSPLDFTIEIVNIKPFIDK